MNLSGDYHRQSSAHADTMITVYHAHVLEETGKTGNLSIYDRDLTEKEQQAVTDVFKGRKSRSGTQEEIRHLCRWVSNSIFFQEWPVQPEDR